MLARKVLADDVVKTTYLSYQYLESKALLLGLLEKPQDFMTHLQRFSLSFATQVTYGFRTPTHNHPLVKKIFYVSLQGSHDLDADLAVLNLIILG